MRRDLSLALFCSALALALPGVVAAQDTTSFRFNAQHARFDAAGTGLSVTASPQVLPAWRGGGGVMLHVTSRPFALRETSGGERKVTAVIQQSALVAELRGAFGFGGIADLGIVMPVAPVVVWGQGADGLPAQDGLDGGAVGDLTFIPKVQVLSPEKTGVFGFGVQVPVSVPTGQPVRYFGDGGPNVAVDLLAELRVWRLRVLLNVSPIHVRPKAEYGDVVRQFGMDWRGGLALQVLDTVALRGEAWGTVSYVGNSPDLADRATAEWAFSVAMTPGDLVQLELGVGSGLGGFATPGVRAFAGVRVTAPGPKAEAEAVEEVVAPVETPVVEEPAAVEEQATESVEEATEAMDEATEGAVDEAAREATEEATEATEAAREATEAVEEATEEVVDEATETAEEAGAAAEEAVEAAEETTEEVVDEATGDDDDSAAGDDDDSAE